MSVNDTHFFSSDSKITTPVNFTQNMSLNQLNPAYEAIGKGFVQQYYVLFDDPSQRPSLAAMYNVSVFFLTLCDIYLLPTSNLLTY